ncbi:MAG: CDP-alcohol phosphatidyltransferase family protein [Candidatus Omnitrophica bacterium]|nr:CDP-alcohol phosphatidyltransferase family protein [Candidatus Omnitrophota bacterium]
MFRKSVYPKIEPRLNEIAKKLHTRGITPHQLTLAGLALSFLAGCVYATGLFFMGAVVLLIACLGDMLDGPLARVGKTASTFGAFFDSTLDRYSDFFVFGGLVLFFARQNQGLWLLVSLGILAGSFITSYAKARAEALIGRCPVGVFERSERIGFLVLGSLVWPLMPLCLWILLIGTNGTAIQRILYVWKESPSPSPSEFSAE